MTTWFCLGCFGEVEPNAPRCPTCGHETSPSDRTYEEMLIRALDHRLPDRRVLAARILGQRRSLAATEDLARLALDRSDLYLQAAAARALATIDTDHPLVRRLATGGPLLVRDAIAKADP